MKSEYPFCEVEWVDSYSEGAILEVSCAQTVVPKIRLNVGYCLLEDDEKITLISGVVKDIFKGQTGVEITYTIPKVCIKRITYIEGGDARGA